MRLHFEGPTLPKNRCGVVLTDGVVTACPPMLGYLKDKPIREVIMWALLGSDRFTFIYNDHEQARMGSQEAIELARADSDQKILEKVLTSRYQHPNFKRRAD